VLLRVTRSVGAPAESDSVSNSEDSSSSSSASDSNDTDGGKIWNPNKAYAVRKVLDRRANPETKEVEFLLRWCGAAFMTTTES